MGLCRKTGSENRVSRRDRRRNENTSGSRGRITHEEGHRTEPGKARQSQPSKMQGTEAPRGAGKPLPLIRPALMMAPSPPLLYAPIAERDQTVLILSESKNLPVGRRKPCADAHTDYARNRSYWRLIGKSKPTNVKFKSLQVY